MNIQELTAKCTELDNHIKSTIKSDAEDTYPILDGVFDPERYLSAKYKILWILKEPYDEFDENGVPFGGGWHLKDAILPKQKIQEFKGGRRTFEPMVYVAWGILNNFCLWDDMDYVSANPSMLEAFKSIAYINVKKLPGLKTSYYKTIKDAYNKHKNILLKQIEYFNPDIIIGGGTLNLFIDDLDLSNKDIISYNEKNYYIKDNRIYIDAYHPAQLASTEVYCNDIINAVKNWATNNS